MATGRAASRHLPPSPAPVEIDPGRSLQSYNFYDRLAIVTHHPQAGFRPTTKEELGLAFRLMYTNAQRKTVRDYLGSVTAHQQTDTVSVAPAAASESILAQMAAFATQAERDTKRLTLARRDFVNLAEGVEPQTTLLQVFNHTPAYQGPGQIVRFKDIGQVADDGTTDGLGFNPFGKIRQLPGQHGKAVIDPYTASDRPANPAVAVHIAEVMDGMLVDDIESEGIFTNAYFDQQIRRDFWLGHLGVAGRDAQGEPVIAGAPAWHAS